MLSNKTVQRMSAVPLSARRMLGMALIADLFRWSKMLKNPSEEV